jgi:hypothetical protein
MAFWVELDKLVRSERTGHAQGMPSLLQLAVLLDPVPEAFTQPGIPGSSCVHSLCSVACAASGRPSRPSRDPRADSRPPLEPEACHHQCGKRIQRRAASGDQHRPDPGVGQALHPCAGGCDLRAGGLEQFDEVAGGVGAVAHYGVVDEHHR